MNNNDFNPFLVGPLDGHWSDWSEWSPCAKSCGGSRVTRKRSCNNPSPQRGGEECPGEPTETAFDCETPCPGTYVKCIMGHNHFHDIALNLIQSDNHCNFCKFSCKFLVSGETGKGGPYVVQLVELEIKLGQENATTPPHSMEESVLGTARKRKHAR